METIENLGIAGARLIQSDEYFKLGTDGVLLSRLLRFRPGQRVLELGCGIGGVLCIVCAENPKVYGAGVEILPGAAEIARRNLELNGFSSRAKIICADMRTLKENFDGHLFDAVLLNPPYFKTGSGKTPLISTKTAARFEDSCDILEGVAAASRLVKYGGKAGFIYRAERLCDLLCAMRQFNLEPKRLQFWSSEPGKEPSLVLAAGLKGGKPGLKYEYLYR